jgi:CheY-like chemotaxis protein
MRLAGGQAAPVDQVRTMMERQLTQLVRLVDDLLDVSRISRGKLELRRECVELAAVVQSAVETSRPLIELMGHELKVTLPQRPIMVDADLTRLAQVFMNLLNNAAKYTERGGCIRLTAERQGSEVVVSVKDTGIGIAAEQLPHIFGLFAQVDHSMEKSQGGLGIGLTLVQRLVEMHGGSVEVRSEGLGEGAEFVVRLPVVMEEVQPERQDGNDRPVTPKLSRRILIVDDNRDGADSLAAMLRLLGNDTRTAYDGLEGVRVAGEYRPDVVLLDIGLPRLNGCEACRRIREQLWGKKIVLIAVTGWGQEDDRRRSQEAGFDHHLVKPLDPDELGKLLADPLPRLEPDAD